MINLKKAGLSALAGSLVAFSASAADVSVSGGVELTYTDTGGNSGNEVTGNSYGANSGITFAASGDVGFGTLSMTRSINDTATGWGSTFQTLDLGDAGVLSFDGSGGALVGYTANDDVLPTAYEESWNGVAGSGIVGVGSTNVIGYRNSFGGVSVSAGYTNADGAAQTGESAVSGPGGHGSIADIYVSSSDLMENVTVGFGHAESSATNVSTTTTDTTSTGGSIVYSAGQFSVGYRLAHVDSGAASTAGQEIVGYSLAFNLNDNFAISYGAQDTKHEAIGATAKTTEEVVGYNAAYTVGAASVRFSHSQSDRDGGVAGADDEHTELSLVLSF
jgi:outer membrane protein OmpU